MGMTTERKVYIGLALAGVAALVIDRGVFSPANASADSIPVLASTSPTTGAKENTVEKTPAIPAARILSQRLEEVDDESDAKSHNEAFSLSSWLQNTNNQMVNDQTVVSTMDAGHIVPPTDLPKVSSVLPMADKVGAVLDGRYMVIGQSTKNGYQLKSVQNRSVVVEKDDKEYILSLQAVPGSGN